MMGKVTFIIVLFFLMVTIIVAGFVTIQAVSHLQSCNLIGADFGQVYMTVLKGC